MGETARPAAARWLIPFGNSISAAVRITGTGDHRRLRRPRQRPQSSRKLRRLPNCPNGEEQHHGLRKRSCGTKIMEACRPQTGEARACRTEAAPPPPWRCARRCARHVPCGGKNNSPSGCRISDCRARRCFFIGHARLAESLGQCQSRK